MSELVYRAKASLEGVTGGPWATTHAWNPSTNPGLCLAGR